MQGKTIDIFNKVKMGYSVIQTNRIKEWRVFGQECLGMHLAKSTGVSLAFRLDEHDRRIMVETGPAEDVVVIGIELADKETLNTVLQRLKGQNVEVAKLSSAEAKNRGVEALWGFIGPKNLTIELYTKALKAKEPLDMLTSAFVTGDAGFGHYAMTSKEPERMVSFWEEIFDARTSDFIEQKVNGLMLDIRFLRFNERHHSVAVAATRGQRLDPIRTRIQHMNIQAKSLDDLTAAYQRCKKMGYKMARGVGQHPNDRELSFYVISPSGFEIEFGWEPIAVEEEGWETTTYKAISIWGHKPEGINQTVENIKQGVTGVSRLFTKEYYPY